MSPSPLPRLLFFSHTNTPQNNTQYPHDVEIDVEIDMGANRIVIKDNCSGMAPKVLEECVLTAGESKKKGVSWLNGIDYKCVRAWVLC